MIQNSIKPVPVILVMSYCPRAAKSPKAITTIKKNLFISSSLSYVDWFIVSKYTNNL